MNHIIEVEDLRKSYGSVVAVADISFYVEAGGLFAFLGPNGAGKTTTINVICTFLKPDAGRVSVNGYLLGRDDNAIRKSIGVVFQDNLLDNLLTVEENLRCRGALYGLSGKALTEAVKRAMAEVEITDLAKRPYGKLSGGQRRRCDIARALINTPEILFLDEPTTGLDPQTRKLVWEIIRKLQREAGVTVFLTTHYMEEAADADYVIVIDNGKIAAKGRPTDLRERYAKDKLSLVYSNPEAVLAGLSALNIPHTKLAGRIIIPIKNTLDALPLIERFRPNISGFEVMLGTMDDAFIGITGKELRQ